MSPRGMGTWDGQTGGQRDFMSPRATSVSCPQGTGGRGTDRQGDSMTLCPQGPPVSLGGHGDTSWCHVLEGHGDVGQTWGHPTFMSPRATGVPWGAWGHGGTWDRHGDSVTPCPKGRQCPSLCHVPEGHGDTGQTWGHLLVPCPLGTWGHGTDMGTPRLHVPKGHRCPLGDMGTQEGQGWTDMGTA